MDRMIGIERYLDTLDLARLEDERQLDLEAWTEGVDPWRLTADDDDQDLYRRPQFENGRQV